MVKKDKVFELKIQEDDDISGIDSISLVDDPAIEINWVAFNKDKEHDFTIPDGEDLKYSELITQKGQSEDDLISDGWEVFSTEVNGKKNFVSSSPNDSSIEDTAEYLIRYKYILNPEAPGAPIKETTREFCKDLILKNYVYRVEDLEAITNDLGSSALVWRGSYNCRHIWQQITYHRKIDGVDVKITNKASVRKGRVDGAESLDVLGYPQPDTRVPEWPSFSKQDYFGHKVSFDYDGTLSTEEGQKLAKKFIDEGDTVYIVTARNRMDAGPVYRVADSLKIPHDRVHFTGGKSKFPILKELGIQKHYDNNPDVIDEIKKSSQTIQGIKFDYNVGSIGGYVDPGIKKKKKGFEKSLEDSVLFSYLYPQQFADSYSDYPDSVKNNAKAVLKYVEENGWGSCGTEVGKVRANQLANGESISLDTVKRMYSYLSRHEVDLESSKGYGDGCGKLMYDSWGGKSALSWAESKINQAEKMSTQKFAIDSEEKRIILGPAMIPDLNIFRRDALGNPYYVFFSSETIRMIAEKYMKNKFIDNNDQMHDGKAVKDVYVIESWIKEDENDKSVKYGYGELPVGTWFVSMKVNNPDIWAKVKEGMLNGFSVSGFFEEVKSFTKEEMFLYKVAEILKNTKD